MNLDVGSKNGRLGWRQRRGMEKEKEIRDGVMILRRKTLPQCISQNRSTLPRDIIMSVAQKLFHSIIPPEHESLLEDTFAPVND